MKIEDDPFELGWAAGLRGDNPRQCPYDTMTLQWWEWQFARRFAVDMPKHVKPHGSYPKELTDDQIAYVRERAAARQAVWGRARRAVWGRATYKRRTI